MTREYLIVDEFLHDALQARTLQAAFETGVIDRLADQSAISGEQLAAGLPCDPAGLRFLMQVLEASGVVYSCGSEISLTERFRHALQFRDLIETRLEFAGLVAADFFERLPQFLQSSADFMATARLFELFDYSRCRDVTPQNCLQAARWMKLTTTLTRYEAPVCHQNFAFHRHRRMLDVGGNSGEFALQICRRELQIDATIVDLPVVCHVGSRHVSEHPESARIHFQPLHVIHDPLPTEFDLITCKSVLHDWPEELTETILRKCLDSLLPGGCLLIFERLTWDFRIEAMPYSLLPVLLFFRSYRQPEFYSQLLDRIGFTDIQTQRVQLEVPFLLLTACKPAVRRDKHDASASD